MIIETKYTKERILQEYINVLAVSLYEEMKLYFECKERRSEIQIIKENALKCQYNGGFIAVGCKVDENKHYVVDELTAPIVRDAFTMYVNGRPIKDIVTYMNENGVRSSQNKPLTKTSVSAILRNRRYIGEYRYRDVVIPNGMPAIISEELFSLAQARIEKNKQAPAASKASVKYIFSTKMFCGDCGALMVGECVRNRNGKVFHYYKCSSVKKKTGNCSRHSLRKDEIEELVISQTVNTVFDDSMMNVIADKVFEYQKQENTVIPLLRRELAVTEKSIGNFVKAIEMGIFCLYKTFSAVYN